MSSISLLNACFTISHPCRYPGYSVATDKQATKQRRLLPAKSEPNNRSRDCRERRKTQKIGYQQKEHDLIYLYVLYCMYLPPPLLTGTNISPSGTSRLNTASKLSRLGLRRSLRLQNMSKWGNMARAGFLGGAGSGGEGAPCGKPTIDALLGVWRREDSQMRCARNKKCHLSFIIRS